MLVGKRPAGAQKIFGAFKDSAFAKDGLEHNGASVGIDGRTQGFDIVLRHKGHVFEQRLKTFAVLVLSGEGHGAERPAVIRALQRDQLRLGVATRFVSGETRQLDGAFHGLGATVREEDAIETRKLAQALGQLSLIFVVIKIRQVNDAGGLLADGLHDARMRMTQSIHTQAGNEVEILFAFEVVEKNTFAALEAYRIAVVGGEKKTLFKINDLIEAGHIFIVERERRRGEPRLYPFGFSGSKPAAVMMARPSSSAERNSVRPRLACQADNGEFLQIRSDSFRLALWTFPRFRWHAHSPLRDLLRQTSRAKTGK